LTKIGIRKETEPGAVGILDAAVKTLELICRLEKARALTVGAFPGNETLEVHAVSRIRKPHEKKKSCKN
jgi:hypothetical protein